MSAIPLWNPLNKTMFSDSFNVAPGKVCVLTAANLEREKVRVDNSEFTVPQMICIRKIIHTSGVQFQKNAMCETVALPCPADEVVDAVVQSCHGCWSLSYDNTIGIIGLPGTYRLELNDATAVGVAQVYAEFFEASAIPPQLERLFF